MASSPVLIQPGQNGINRRSLSIFSRRGTETPPPPTQALAATAMAIASPATTSASASAQPSRAKRWKMGKSVEKVPEGTILRMVPKEVPAAARILSPLELEMATSPNDEILRNIGRQPSEPTSPASAVSSPTIEFTHTMGMRKPTKKERKNSQADIIGIWKNGKAEWDSTKLGASEEELVARPRTSDGVPNAGSLAAGKRPQRPSIRVVIPNRDSIRRPLQMLSRSAIEPSYSKDITISHTIHQEISPPTLQSGETASPFQFSAVSPPTVTFAPQPRRISHTPINIAAIMEQAMKAPETAPRKSSEHLNVHSRRPSAISSSDSSSVHSSDNEGSSQVNSSRTSMTSVGSRSDERRSVSPKPIVEEKQVVPTIVQPNGRPANISVHRPITLTDAPMGSPTSPVELEGSPVEGPRLASLVEVMRQESAGRAKRRMSSRRGTKKLSQKSSKEKLWVEGAKSPSLSQAEHELEAHLNVIGDSIAAAKEIGTEQSKPVVLQSAMITPPIPPKSVKRRYPYASPASPQISVHVKKRRSYRVDKPLPAIPKRSSRRIHQKRLSFISEEQERKITAKAAETVVFKILNELDTLDDLFNAALANKGFYRVFKRNELSLMRNTLKKMNPAAWEYRETCLTDMPNQEPETPKAIPDYTPTTYFETYTRDTYIIGALKILILEECQSFLRDETVQELKVHDPFHPSRVDCALWRIWTFCRVFGSNKGREDDIVAQMDWLRGGILAHQDTCTSTIASSDSFYLSGVLLSAPEHFGQGNKSGLSAEELYDMTEMWNCLNHITQAIIGRTAEARQYGVYDCTEVRGGDIDGEETMLEEWHSYLLSLGLGPILSLASHNSRDDASIFVLSQQNGWTDWTAPMLGGSRSTFLREAVARLYEEKICETFSTDEAKSEEMKQLRRDRGAGFAAEIKQRRMNGASVRSERPMSAWEDVLEKLSAQGGSSQPSRSAPSAASASRRPSHAPSHSSIISPIAEDQSNVHPLFRTATIVRKPVWQGTSPNPQAVALPPSPPISHISLTSSHSRASSSSDILPAYRDSSKASMQHPRQYEMADPQAINSVDRAVFRIVEMGFSPEEAKGALKITDMGDGLRVDRAVEFLLRQAEGIPFYQNEAITQ